MSNTTHPPSPTRADDQAPAAVPPAPERPVLALSATALAAGALAAVTSAVIGSHLGTTGTLAGAAVGSVIGAVSTALYTFGLQRTWQAFSAMTPRRARLVAGVLLTALAAFVLSLGVITSVEKVAGTSLAGNPGTTVSNAGRTSPDVSAPSSDAERVLPDQPTSEATDPAPTQTPAPSPEPTEAADPTATPAPTTPAPDPAETPAPTVTSEPTSPAVGAGGVERATDATASVTPVVSH